jgi:epoxyqueuosine reductase QueG
MTKKETLTAWVIGLVENFLAGSPLNNLQNKDGEPAWEEALVGFASGADPLFQEFNEYIGPFHWTPLEIFNQFHPGNSVTPEDLTVISWILPQRKAVRDMNRKAKKFPAEEWARVRIEGEKCNAGLRAHVAKTLTDAGYPSVAPMLAPNWAWVKSKNYGYASSWSERHAAYAAGLGTFGLCDGLITPKGKAMRAGSVVAKIQIKPSIRFYNNHRAWCSFFADGSCGKCIDRCPVRALTTTGHDKETCRQHLIASSEYVKKTYNYEGYGCGLCQVGVPCETRIPVKKAREAFKKGELPPPPPPLA